MQLYRQRGHKSKGSGVKLSREAVPLIRRRGRVVPDVGAEVGRTAWKEECEAGFRPFCILRGSGGPASV